uniref:Secreted protein n=1 Tax=Steinernema glaseri TaxID=37863 RepID=A0A1I7YQV2_9BILA
MRITSRWAPDTTNYRTAFYSILFVTSLPWGNQVDSCIGPGNPRILVFAEGNGMENNFCGFGVVTGGSSFMKPRRKIGRPDNVI